MQSKQLFAITLAVFTLGVTGCGGGGGAGPDTSSCPRWKVGDTMNYLKTTTISNVSSTANSQFVVSEHTQTRVILTNVVTSKQYDISADGHYFDTSTELSFCPPAAVGEKSEGLSWVPGPIEGTGDFAHWKFLVTDIAIESAIVPAGEFTAKKIVLKKTTVFDGTTDPVPVLPDATITQYYVGGIGIVKQVVVTPTTNTTITDELTAFSYAP